MKRIVISGFGKQVPREYQNQITIDRKEYQEIRVDEECFQAIDRKFRKRLDRYIQLGVLAATEAVTKSGFGTSGDNDHKSIIAASAFGSVSTIAQDVPAFCESGQISPLFIPKVVMNMFAGNLAIVFGVKGVNYTMGTGFNASLDAIIDGVELLEEGRAESVLVVASESCLGEYGKQLFHAYKNNSFYENADLYVEGSGALVLETLESAQKRNAVIYGEIIGYEDFFQKGDDKTARLFRLAGGKQVQGNAMVCGYGSILGDTFQILDSSDNYFGASHPMLYVIEALEKMAQGKRKEVSVYAMNSDGGNSFVSIQRYEE